jgi:hypothetical protein
MSGESVSIHSIVCKSQSDASHSLASLIHVLGKVFSGMWCHSFIQEHSSAFLLYSALGSVHNLDKGLCTSMLFPNLKTVEADAKKSDYTAKV